MGSLQINGEGELTGLLANPGSSGKMAVKMEYVCVCIYETLILHAVISITVTVYQLIVLKCSLKSYFKLIFKLTVNLSISSKLGLGCRLSSVCI